ncbi:MAG TPA: serine hydrolase [Steroidobacteraceae bacterium]|nr:serine hydrolase [Steroidobacteraceae bacterium]
MTTDSAARLLDDLPDALERAIAASAVPGAVLAIQHGEHRHVASAGVLNASTGVAVTPDAIFQIGSVTKVLTATLVMQLVDAGLLSLDAPVLRYLPQLQLNAAPAPASLQVRHLLNHTSGIDGDFFLDTGRNDDALEKYAAACAALPLLAAPGSYFSYCNAGYAILGRIVEVVTGNCWDDVLRDRLLHPIDATESATRAEQAVRLRAAVGHQLLPDGRTADAVDRLTLPRSLGPAGFTLAMTATGLLDFMLAHFAGGTHGEKRIVSAESAAAMQTPSVTLADDTSWGLGWKVIDSCAARLIGHDGGAAGQGAFLWGIPARKLAVALLHNGGNSALLQQHLVARALRELGEWSPIEPPPVRSTPLDLAAFAGVYENIGMRLTVRAEADRLRVVGEHLQIPAPPPDFILVPLADGRFAAHLTPGGEPIVVAFLERDTHGRPAYLSIGRLHRRVA